MSYCDQPGPGGKVRDKHDRAWTRTGDTGGSDWELDEAAGFEPESWGRVCESGPLAVTDEGEP